MNPVYSRQDLDRFGGRVSEFKTLPDKMKRTCVWRDTMKKILLGTVALVALGIAAPASAADLAARPYTKAPPPMIAAIYDWSGFYIGLNGGGGSAHKCWDLDQQRAASRVGSGPKVAITRPAARSVVRSVTAGRRATGCSVLKPGQLGRLHRLQHQPVLPGGHPTSTKVDAFGLFTGQVGYAWNNALFYVKGGAAVVSDKYTTYAHCDRRAHRLAPAKPAGVARLAPVSNSASRRTGRLASNTTTCSWAPRASTPTTPGRRVHAQPISISQDVDIGTVRLNYRWGGPVVAKY